MTFNEWLKERETMDEGIKDWAKKALATSTLAASTLFPQYTQAAPPAPQAQSQQVQQDVIEKDGVIYARGFARIAGSGDARAKLNAMQVSKIKAMSNLTKHLYGSTTSGGTTTTSGKLPPGVETVRQTEKNGGIECIIKLQK